MRTNLSLFALAVLLSGCASGSSQPPAKSVTVPAASYESVDAAIADSKSDDIVCTHEKKIGSHMKKASCMTVQQREDAAKKSQETIERTKARESRGGPANQ